MRERRGLSALVAVVVLGAIPFAVPHAARGDGRDRITLAVNQTLRRSYGALPGANPVPKEHNDDLNFPSDPDPDTCASVPSCDVIPLTVQQPAGLSVFDTFTLAVDLAWTGSSDLDLYLWYDPQGDVPAKKAATTANPEHIDLADPRAGRYQIVVNNAVGTNGGYALTLVSRYARGERPSEFGGDTATPRPGAGGFVEGSSPAPPAAVPPSAAPPPGTAAPSNGGLVTVAPLDSDLAALAGVADGASRAPDIFRSGSSDDGPHAPVGGGAVALWAVFVPALALGAAGLALYRRRPTLPFPR